ncbi:site-specific DNA-methyltransferase [Halostella sp. JP-L12]|uniref:DNA-methyltransferase n=1 Tax=Halostella TaxID=1843185 RepID=UPI000EF8070B|nr:MULTISPECIES: site-specific DNA-methyltransferase [Halostella]NHN48429.1 site-specific DNA-methyltransferase [Halostella sp. JP-L12]
METTHEVHVGDARSMAELADDSVELVVTSPPYPMIEMWDETFASLDPAVGEALDAADGDRAFDLMHDLLDEVWAEVARVLVPGGIACVNVGDATRSIGDSFQQFPNHVQVTETFRDLGFQALPDVLWRKPTNKASKFMGSGMLPPNAYVTLEHEYVLVFRNGGSRRFEPNATRRYESAYFWEERNEWFSDVWTDVRGRTQELDDAVDPELRERSGAYPLAIPYRLVNMYSVRGDTVLDPFWGTGTTTAAAMASARNSVGYELSPSFVEAFDDYVDDVPALSNAINERRLADHREFVAEVRADGDSLGYEAEHYDAPVRTKQEREIRLYSAADVRQTETGYAATHEPF